MKTTAKSVPHGPTRFPAAHTTQWRRKPLALAIAALAGLPLAAPHYGWAAPAGGQVTAGTGTITQNGALTTIDQGSQRLAIDWRSFDINSGETVKFQQP